jgi:hypothetical protein
MWDIIDELLHRDPRHDALAFCLIWWIPLLLVPLAWWVSSRIWRELAVCRRWILGAVFLFPICLAIMQFATNWYLAGYWAPLLVYPLAVAGYACLVFLLWLSYNRWLVRGIYILLLLPVGLIVFASFNLILLMGMFAFPHASGRLSATVTWRTDWTSMSITSDWVAYSIYANPRWFPLVKRQVIEDRCFTSAIVEGNPGFHLTPDGKTVIVTCWQEDGTVANKAIQVQ